MSSTNIQDRIIYYQKDGSSSTTPAVGSEFILKGLKGSGLMTIPEGILMFKTASASCHRHWHEVVQFTPNSKE